MKHTDEQLIEEYLSGNKADFERIVNRYLKRIFNFVLQLTRDKYAAEDIAQDVFVKVWKNISSFDSKKKFSTWLFAIAKNTTYDFLKKKKTLPFSMFETDDGNILEYIEDETILHSQELLKNIDNAKVVKKLLSELPVQTQTILLLHHTQGFSLEEIAEILGSSPNTLKSRYRRTILHLRKIFLSKKSAPESSPVA